MDFIQEYIEEAKQVLKSLEGALMQFEQQSADPEEINTVYRYLHTLKGSAGMFGFHDVERLSHELESVYSDIRDGVRQQDEFIIDLTLHAVDVLGDLLDGKDAVKEADKIIGDINNIQSGADVRNTSTTSGSTSGKEEGFVIILRPEKEIFKRGINFQAIVEDIHQLGICEFIIHNEAVPFERQLANKQIESWFEIILTSSVGLENVKDVFLFMKQTEYSVLQITGAELFASESYKNVIKLNDQDIRRRIEIINGLNPAILTDTKQVAVSPPASPSQSRFGAGPTGNVEEQIDAVATVDDEDSDEDEQSTRIIRKSKKNGNVTVATQKLDQLINIVSELVIFRSEIHHLMGDTKNREISEALEKLERLTLRLRDSAFNIRLVPLNILNVKLQRLIRTVSKELGKEVEFITEGLDTELDRSMINALEAPLMHIIRNAIDHGIERPEERERRNKPRKGLLKFYSYNSGDHVFIQMQDDGNGIDFDKIRAKGIEKGLLGKSQNYSEKELLNVMMAPGFSTADQVTTVSGRGVGMDVVKKDIAAIRGDIEVSTEKGLGSIFTLRLPLTLTILDTLVVKVSDNKYLLPISEVQFCYEEDHAKLFNKKSRQINFQGQLMPFVSLREYFGIEEKNEKETVIVVNKNDTKIAVVVDGILGKLQTVYKPLNELLHPAQCFSGASILGDGSMAFILNALKLSA
jgi:two-component system chemotaxis sensor kinase CheA